jgi:putative RNA 2'-phosphotransferase
MDNMPVTRLALEASWEAIAPFASLWHGTSLDALPGIGRLGITSSHRTHVHLAESVDSKVGKRAHVDVLIEIGPEALRRAGLGVFRAQNGVVLVERVPLESIVAVHPVGTDRRSLGTACRAASLPLATGGG